MKNKILLSLLLSLISLASFAQKKWTTADHYHFFVLTIDTSLCESQRNQLCQTINKIEISEKGDKQNTQTIIPIDTLFLPFFDSSFVFVVEDVNFDGQNDIRLLGNLTANMQTEYNYWLYDKTTGQFKTDTNLNKLSNPRFNPTNKTIHTWWRNGASHNGHALYTWNNNQIVLIAQEEEEWITGNNGYLITTIIVNGSYVTTSKTIHRSRINIYSKDCSLFKEK